MNTPLSSPPQMDEGLGGALTAFPIVGIGASAGGLEAFEHFFRAYPTECGIGFVLVPHLDPAHASLLSQILQRSTTMPVVEATDRLAVAANHVYIIPPNREMTLLRPMSSRIFCRSSRCRRCCLSLPGKGVTAIACRDCCHRTNSAA